MPAPKRSPHPSAPLEVIDPLWLLKAVGFTLIAALLCAWLALCLLFYQGQWQLVLHPLRSPQVLDRVAGIPAVALRFDASETGVPRLSGALLAPAETTRLSAYTVLYLRGGDGSLVQSPTDDATVALLHGLGLSVFVFDYRGFGSSDAAHPNLKRMTEDSDAALRYLVGRGIAESRIVLYGSGVGASLATSLALAHAKVPALILDAPTKPSLALVRADPRTRALPVGWLFHEDFSLAGLTSLGTPKLLISYPTPGESEQPAAYTVARTPKTTLELPLAQAEERGPAVGRFLDEYLPGASR